MFFAAMGEGAEIISQAVDISSSPVGTNKNDFLILETPQEGFEQHTVSQSQCRRLSRHNENAWQRSATHLLVRSRIRSEFNVSSHHPLFFSLGTWLIFR